MQGFATLGLFLAALGALRQIGEAKKGRFAVAAADFSRRWDERDLVETRQLIRQYDDGDALCTAYFKLENNKTSDVALKLLREPDYFEDLAILEDQGLIDTEFVRRSLGGIIPSRWEWWRSTLNQMRASDPDHSDNYPNFRALAKKSGAEDTD
jgi:hypothetical protein